MRWVRWAAVITAGLVLAGAAHGGSSGSGGGSLPMPTPTRVTTPSPPASTGTAAAMSAQATTPPPTPAAMGDGATPISSQRETQPGLRPNASDRSPVPWILLGAIVITACLAVHTWWRRRRVLG